MFHYDCGIHHRNDAIVTREKRPFFNVCIAYYTKIHYILEQIYNIILNNQHFFMFHYDCEIHHRNGAIVTREKRTSFNVCIACHTKRPYILEQIYTMILNNQHFFYVLL